MRRIIESHVIRKTTDDLPGCLLEHFNHIPTRSSAKKALKKSRVLVNGRVFRESVLREGESEVALLERKPPPRKPLRINLRILYEDRWVAVIEKPPGIPVSGNRYRTVENALFFNLNRGKPDTGWSPSPAHRLDNQTGGLMIIAKDELSLVDLSGQFENQKITKRYRAVVAGKMTGDGVIEGEIEGRPARTIYRSARISPSLKTGHLTLVDLWPVTGRRNQLRIHLAAAGCPVIGDKLYSGEAPVLKGKGLFLWSVEISFRHPVTGYTVTVRIEEPKKFTRFVDREERRWNAYNG